MMTYREGGVGSTPAVWTLEVDLYAHKFTFKPHLVW